MQDPNRDTEWNDILRAKGIIPPKETELTEDDIVSMVENTIEQKSQGKSLEEMTLDELNENEDEIDEEEERIFEQYRRQRMAEMREAQQRSKFGEVREISKSDWVTEVNKAGDGVWVVIHVYKPSEREESWKIDEKEGKVNDSEETAEIKTSPLPKPAANTAGLAQLIPICKLMNQHLTALANKFPQTKFLRSVSSVCIPNYPDKNLPTIFVYYENDMKKQFVGPLAFGGMNITQNELEWMLSQTGAIQTDLEEPPKPEIKDVMNIAIRDSAINNNDSDDD